jgi:outer membrane lipoprotein-sorting protein
MPDTFELNFQQSFKSALGRNKTSMGKIDYSYPSRLRFKEFKGNSEFISNPDKSWYYIPPFMKGEKGEVQINSTKKLAISKLFDELKKGLKSNSSYAVKFKKNKYILSFSSDAIDKLNVKTVYLYPLKGKSITDLNDLSKMTIIYKDKKSVDIIIKKLNSQVKFKESHFVFDIPPNTNIIKN